MRKNKIIYWVSTSILGAMMLFSGYAYFTNPEVKEGFVHLGFPDYFRQELGVFKIIGAVVLLLPQVPKGIKEWAYAGFGITFVSAFIAHLSSGDGAGMAGGPLVFLLLLTLSYVYFNRLQEVKPAVIKA